MSETLYRKYRPKTFKEVLGQEQVVKVLEAAIKNKKVSHAYLFAGSRGTGKTSVARIFAVALGVVPEDLYEIDAASNRGIDEIRALREAVHTLPFRSPYKVYIIDEAHMLTREAWNALLKTLEEPPSHVLFIFATTELEKVLDTVVSRCEIHTFKKPTHQVLRDVVTDIAQKEKAKLEPSSADLIATLAEGSFRDAQGILQKVLSYSTDKTITAEEVAAITGAPRSELLNEVLKAIEEGGIERALGEVDVAVGQNVDMTIFLKLLAERVRLVLLLRFAKRMESRIKSALTDTDYAFLKSLADNAKSKINSAVLDELLAASKLANYATVPQLPLELALIKLLAIRQ